MEPLVLRTAINAPRDLIWDYVSTAGGLACWQADTVIGSLSDGEFSLRWPQLGARMDLSVAEVTRGERIVLRAGETALELTLGDRELLLQHHGLHEEDDWIGLESSWRAALSVLALAITHHPRVERTVHWMFQPVVASAELVHHYFTDKGGLELWLGSTKQSLKQGCPFELDINCQIISGQVLCAERDVCLAVDQWRNGALTLRTLPAPDEQRVAVVGVSTWGFSLNQVLIDHLESSLNRLSRSAHCAQS
jgi:uncharacterized protein YndB with AHSA1/START domain